MAHAIRRRSLVLAMLMLTAVSTLLVACGVTRVVAGEVRKAPGPTTTVQPPPIGADAFAIAGRGDCLTWPEETPGLVHIVDCSDEHRFEVSEILDVTRDYGPGAPPPTSAEIQRLTQERCEAATRRYLGPKYDPNSRFTISALWPGEHHWRQTGERRMLCGLQLAGTDGRQLTFTGRIADQDQSKVWPAGTCIGIDTATNQPTEVPVDCAAPHAMEVTGMVDVGTQFPGATPAEPDQDAFIKDACIRATESYLAPVGLRETTLTVVYSTIQQASWDAGSRQVPCLLGAAFGGGWATLVNSAKGPLLINGRPPAP